MHKTIFALIQPVLVFTLIQMPHSEIRYEPTKISKSIEVEWEPVLIHWTHSAPYGHTLFKETVFETHKVLTDWTVTIKVSHNTFITGD